MTDEKTQQCSGYIFRGSVIAADFSSSIGFFGVPIMIVTTSAIPDCDFHGWNIRFAVQVYLNGSQMMKAEERCDEQDSLRE